MWFINAIEKVWSFLSPAPPWLAPAIGWLGSNVFTYWLGRKQALDKIRIPKRHDLAKDMLARLHEDYSRRASLRQMYKANFSHLETLSEAMKEFERFDTMYVQERQLIDELRLAMVDIQRINREGSIYFSRRTFLCIEAYIKNTQFTYISLGEILGPLNYNQGFFDNLLNEERFAELTRLYREAENRLRKATR